MARNKKPKVRHQFGKGAEVVVSNPEHAMHEETGVVDTGVITAEGEYAVRMTSGANTMVHADDLDLQEEYDFSAKKEYIIKEAHLKDDFCNYTYEIIKGTGRGDTHKVSGSGLIEDDLRHAFGKFNVHLATIDDVFKHAGVEITDIDELHADDLTDLYRVTGFKIVGSSGTESLILFGSKFVSSAGGRIELKSPKIPLDNLSSYTWYNELKAAADVARREVELYKEGKCVIPDEEEDDKPNPKQLTIGDAIAAQALAPAGDVDDDLDFDEANV